MSNCRSCSGINSAQPNMSKSGCCEVSNGSKWKPDCRVLSSKPGPTKYHFSHQGAAAAVLVVLRGVELPLQGLLRSRNARQGDGRLVVVLLLMMLVVVVVMLRPGCGSCGCDGLEHGRGVAGAQRRRDCDGDGRQLEAAVRAARHGRRRHVLVGLDVHRRLVSASGRPDEPGTGSHQIHSHSFHVSVTNFFIFHFSTKTLDCYCLQWIYANKFALFCFFLTLVGKKIGKFLRQRGGVGGFYRKGTCVAQVAARLASFFLGTKSSGNESNFFQGAKIFGHLNPNKSLDTEKRATAAKARNKKVF